MPTYSKNPYSVNVSDGGAIQVKSGDSLSKYSWAIYGNYTTLDVFKRPGTNGGAPIAIVNKDLIYAGETLIHMPDYSRKNGSTVGIGTPAGSTNGAIGIGGAAAPAALSVSLGNISQTDIDLGAWKFPVKVTGTMEPAHRILLFMGTNPNDCVVMCGDYDRPYLETVLEIIARSDLWAAIVTCKAAVAEIVPWNPSQPFPDGARQIRTFSAALKYPIVYAARILCESGVKTFRAPVKPIDTCPFGRQMLLKIGQEQPPLPFLGTATSFWGSWLTPPIGGRNYFKRDFNNGGRFVVDNAFRGMDCTTYMLAGFGLDTSVAGLYADDIVDLLPARQINQEQIGGSDEIHTFFETHMTGNFVVFHKTHFIAVIDGVAREFFVGAGGYQETPVADRSFPQGSGGKWSIREF